MLITQILHKTNRTFKFEKGLKSSQELDVKEVIDLCAKSIASELSSFLKEGSEQRAEETIIGRVDQMRRDGSTEIEIARKLSELLKNIRETLS